MTAPAAPHAAVWIAGCDCTGCADYVAAKNLAETTAQGLPRYVTEPSVYDRIATVLTAGVPATRRAS